MMLYHTYQYNAGTGDVLSCSGRYRARRARGRREPLKLIIGKYEGTIYPEGNGYTGAIDIRTGADRQRLKRNRTNRRRN